MVSCRYKVFLSFRGEEIRNTFVGHLYRELCSKGIYTFKDDPKLKRGESIGPVILDAIQDSRSSLVVLSPDYASSTWCLSELVKIMESRNREDLKQIVVPIFYKVDPSDVSDHKGKIKEALDKHEANFIKEFFGDEEKYKEAMHKLKTWKEALTQVASLSGWDFQHFRDEATFVKQIVRDISDQLSCESSTEATELVGMCSHITKMDKLLQVEKKVVRIVGIWGIDGLGKTKIARVMFDKLFSQFDAGCFIDNVADKFRKHGVSALKKELLSKTLLEKNLDLLSLDRDSNVIKEKLGRKKVIIVVDDVDNLEQLEVLVKPDWFGLGSRIIITTQDKQLLVSHEVKDIYEVPYLEHDQALQLFSRYAFKQNQPKKGYLELSNSFLSYINGHPLALKVLGSFLFKKSPKQWQSELDKLGTYSNKTIQELLEIGFSGLEDAEKHAFLDIACFFNGENENFVKSILDGCGFFADRTLRVLKDKAMITTSENKLFMHELLQEMGHEIVRKESEEYGERSRLWNPNHIDFVLRKPKETGKVEGIFLDTAKVDNIQIHPQAFRGLQKLRLLKFYNFRSLARNGNVKLTQEGLSSLSEVLRFLHWPEYPLKSLPLKFCPRYLVELNLPNSSIQQLWLGKQPLVNLISVDLNHSDLATIPDLSEAKKLQRLNLQGCTNLTEASSVENLTKLQYLNCKDCENLRNLPSMIKLKFLRTLDLSNCLNLEKIFQLPANIKHLYLVHTAIQELPLPIGSPWRLIDLDLRHCTRLANLPREIFRLKSLKNLNIAGCPRLLRLLTGDDMEIPNEEAKEEKKEEFGKLESTELEIQESSGNLRGENLDGQVDKSVDPTFEQSERIEINVSKFVSTEVSSTVNAPAPNELPNLVPMSPTLEKCIHVSQTDLPHVALTENTDSKADSQLYCADDVSLYRGPAHSFVYSSSSFSFERHHVLDPVSRQKSTNSTGGMVEKESSVTQVPSIKPPTTPVSCIKTDINFEPSMTTAGSITLTSTQFKSKRASTKKVATSNKKRRLNSMPVRKEQKKFINVKRGFSGHGVKDSTDRQIKKHGVLNGIGEIFEIDSARKKVAQQEKLRAAQMLGVEEDEEQEGPVGEDPNFEQVHTRSTPLAKKPLVCKPTTTKQTSAKVHPQQKSQSISKSHKRSYEEEDKPFLRRLKLTSCGKPLQVEDEEEIEPSTLEARKENQIEEAVGVEQADLPYTDLAVEHDDHHVVSIPREVRPANQEQESHGIVFVDPNRVPSKTLSTLSMRQNTGVGMSTSNALQRYSQATSVFGDLADIEWGATIDNLSPRADVESLGYMGSEKLMNSIIAESMRNAIRVRALYKFGPFHAQQVKELTDEKDSLVFKKDELTKSLSLANKALEKELQEKDKLQKEFEFARIEQQKLNVEVKKLKSEFAVEKSKWESSTQDRINKVVALKEQELEQRIADVRQQTWDNCLAQLSSKYGHLVDVRDLRIDCVISKGKLVRNREGVVPDPLNLDVDSEQ